MRIGTLLLLAALVGAPACGGGGSSAGTGPGGSPGPLAASFLPDQPAPPATTIAMEEGSKSNDIVTVNVTLTDTNGVFGAAFEVPFNTPNTSYVGFTPGTAFEQGGNTPIYTVDGATQAGRVIVGVARSGVSATNISGTKTVIGLKFRVNTAGTWPLTFENATLFDGQQPNPVPIPGIGWFSGAVKGV